MSGFYGTRIRKQVFLNFCSARSNISDGDSNGDVCLVASVRGDAHSEKILHGSTVSTRKEFVLSVAYNLINDVETVLLILNRYTGGYRWIICFSIISAQLEIMRRFLGWKISGTKQHSKWMKAWDR